MALPGCFVVWLSLSRLALGATVPQSSLAQAVTLLAQGASVVELEAAVRALQQLQGAAILSFDSTVATPSPSGLPPVLSIHKHTFATADPEAAADFVAAHLGGVDLLRPDHSCPSGSQATGDPIIRDLTMAGTDLALHFVYNPNKSPGVQQGNSTEMGKHIDIMRGNFGMQTNGTGAFDQFMDNHIGMVVESLDPYVDNWEAAGVPFICRTWCCASGMPQYPDACPEYSLGRTSGCEVGCYVEIPYGIIVELQCGLDSYNESLACLTRVQPEVFDLCLVEGANLI